MREIPLNCSNCEAPLINIIENHPEQNVTWAFRAECPHCGDKSYKQEVHGAFVIGSTEYTHMVDYDASVNPIIVKTEKIKEYKT
jgi:Zn finger protein HypA/HybF involved in hydrogenase expression